MSASKPFQTIDQQIETLKDRGMCIGNEGNAKRALLRYGYYTLINGYKGPFIDPNKSYEANGEDRYFDGTSFTDIEALYTFDEALRLATRDALDVAESIMKTATVHAFCYYHRGTEDYLNPSSYIAMDEYYDRKHYTRNLIRLLGTLQSMRDNSLHKEYITHYLNNYSEVPLWVVSQTLTFGNMSAFFDLQELKVQNATCRNIETASNAEHNSLAVKDVRVDYKILTSCRNICSHGERFYCAKYGKRNQLGFENFLEALRSIVPMEIFSDYVSQVCIHINSLDARPKIKEIIINGLGIDASQMLRMID